MLATVLRGEVAEQQSIFIMRAFREMKHFVQSNHLLFNEVLNIKQHQIESDKRIDELFTLMDKYNIDDRQGIFSNVSFELFLQRASVSLYESLSPRQALHYS